MTASPLPSEDEGGALAPELKIGCWELFLAFGGVGLCGFGGVMPWTYRMLVEKRRWLNEEEFANMLSLCQFLPGGNAMNMAICVGSRFAGLAGAVVAFVGLMAMPIAIVLALATAYQSYGRIEAVEQAFHGVSSAAAGLILAMGLKIGWPQRRNPRVMGVAAAVIVAILVLKLPLAWVLLAGIPASILIARAVRR
jgi:chromate transporter